MTGARGPEALASGYLGLGSNVGDRRRHLQEAVDELPAWGVSVLACSSVYETEPVGEVLEQRDFLNACVSIRTPLGPEELLDACKQVERALGRRRAVRHGPRTIDVDLLMLGHRPYHSDRLSLPHPELAARRFVLIPLLELDSELVLADGTPAREALAAIGRGQRVRRAGPPLARPGAPPGARPDGPGGL